jgi:predicted membrane chloride channel (bestrophin family)
VRPKSSNQIDDSYLRAHNHVEELKGFYYSLISYFFVIPFLAFVNYKTSWNFQWFWFPMLGWGIGLAIQAFRVFVNNGAFGRSWEKRKIEEFMREEEGASRWN